MVIRERIFSEEACDDLAERIEKLHRFWSQAHITGAAHMLGAASYYLIRTGGVPAYLAKKIPGNKILRRHFADALEAVRSTIAPHIEGPVYLTDRFGLPGFHIFEAHPEFMNYRIPEHFDHQDTDLDWEDDIPRRPFERLSFTVPIVVPSTGSGLHIWEGVTADMQRHIPTPEMHAHAQEVEPTVVNYHPGEMVIHTGDHLHVGIHRPIPEDEFRVTLQGHGRPTPQGFELYW